MRRVNYDHTGCRFMRSIGVFPALVILVIVAAASIGIAAIIGSNQSTGSSMNTPLSVTTVGHGATVPRSYVCPPPQPPTTTVIGTSTITELHNNVCPPIPTNNVVAYVDSPVTVHSFNHTSFLLHINSTELTTTIISPVTVSDIIAYNGNPEWRYVPFPPFEEESNSSLSGSVLVSRENANVQVNQLNQHSSSSTINVGPQADIVVPYNITADLPAGYYRVDLGLDFATQGLASQIASVYLEVVGS